MFSSQRHLTKAEVTLNYYGHSAVGIASEPDGFQALAEALDKLEKQVAKMKAKWRDTKRNGTAVKAASTASLEPPAVAVPGPRIHRIQLASRRKPMTVDEAVLEIGKDGYLPFRDAAPDPEGFVPRVVGDGRHVIQLVDELFLRLLLPFGRCDRNDGARPFDVDVGADAALPPYA